MMFLLLTAALVGNLFMLPSVLASPLAFFFGRRLMKQAKAQKLGEHQAAEEATAGEPTPSQTRRDTSHRVRSG